MTTLTALRAGIDYLLEGDAEDLAERVLDELEVTPLYEDLVTAALDRGPVGAAATADLLRLVAMTTHARLVRDVASVVDLEDALEVGD